MKVIGLTGHPGSGKDIVGGYLKSKGFEFFSGGDILRELMSQEGLPTDRSHIKEFVEKKRKELGNAYLVEEILRRITRDSVISGFRNFSGVALCREKFSHDFTLIALEAPTEVRYERIKNRKRKGDATSFEQFKKEEDQERASVSGSHEMDAVIASADITLVNTGTKEELYAKLDTCLKKFSI